MKSILYITALMLSTFLYSACYDDKGNYDYTEINKIEVKGILEKYSKVSFTDTLRIEPTITPSEKGGTFEYLWVLNVVYNELPSMGGKIDKDTIGTEKILNYPVNLKLGQYDLVLKVTNIENGYSVFYPTKLEVTTPYSLGFYVLKEENGHTELDLHSPNGEKRENIITKKYGAPMSGTPRSMGLIFSYCYIDPESSKYTFTPALGVCAGDDAKILNLQDMTTIFTYNTMFWGDVPPTNETPWYIYPNSYGIGYLSDKGIYFSYQYLTIPGSGKFGYAMDIENGFKPNTNIILSSNVYFFDELNHRFLACDYNGGIHYYSALPEIPYNLKFFGQNVTGEDTRGYALFSEPNTNKLYWYTMTLNNEYSENPILAMKEVSASSKLNNAGLYAINEQNARIAYFVTDNKAYLYDLESHTEEPLVLEQLPANEEITYISNRYWINPDDSDHNFNYLAIGTYKDGNYNVYLYKTVGGKPTGSPEKTLSGTGKMTKMQFISTSMNDNAADIEFYPGTY